MHNQAVTPPSEAPSAGGIDPAILPRPSVYQGNFPVTWNSGAYTGVAQATLAQLVAWGDSAPAPLGLSAVERVAQAFYGGWIQTEDGAVFQMSGPGIFKHDDGRWDWGGTYHGAALVWASDPGLTLFGGPLPASPYLPTKATWGSLPFGVGLDPSQPDGVATATNLYGWGPSARPAQRLTALEISALKQSGDDRGWVKVQGHSGTGLICLLDPRYARNQDGTWQNRNHAGQNTAGDAALAGLGLQSDAQAGNLGLVIGVASKPKHGVAGFIDAIAHDVSNNPLGAVLFVVVTVSAGGLAPFALAFGEADAVALGVSQAVGSNAVLDANKWAATHPAEIGTVVAGAEIAAVGSVLGIKGLQKFGAGLGAKGIGDAFDKPTPQDPSAQQLGAILNQTSSKPGGARRWWQILGGA